MHSVSFKSHGPVMLSMKLLPYPVNQSCFPSALDKLNETALIKTHGTSCYVTCELIARRYFLKQENEEIEN